MKKVLKITLIIAVIIIGLLTLDFICIFTINRPLLAVKSSTSNKYSGIFYDTYNCAEYAVPQIKSKGTKFTCANNLIITKKVESIVDKTENLDDFACAEALEQFYEDDDYTYYYSCIKSEYIVVKYTDGTEETVSKALKNKTIKISDLEDYNIKYYKYEK